jgi:hypothetical protein
MKRFFLGLMIVVVSVFMSFVYAEVNDALEDVL